MNMLVHAPNMATAFRVPIVDLLILKASHTGAVHFCILNRKTVHRRFREGELVQSKIDKHSDGEIELETYREFSKPDWMNVAVPSHMLAGVSMRDFAGTVETALDGNSINSSAFSRRAMALTARSLEEFYNRELGEVDLVGLLIDSIGIAGTENVGRSETHQKMACDQASRCGEPPEKSPGIP